MRTPAALLCLLSALTVQAGSRPNLVFIYADDMGFGDLACHGHPRIKTPNIDRLAREGVDCRQFTVCNPVCSPSRTAIVTGHFPSRHGVHQHFASHADNVGRGMPDWLDPKAPLLPRVLHDAGYRTAHYGKWHLSGGAIKDAPLPAEYGYDDAAVYTGPGRHVFDGTPYAKLTQSAHDNQSASFLSVAATDHAVEFIRKAGGKPFYLNLWLHETHHLVSATEEEKQAYADTPEPQRTYSAAVSRADRCVGRVLEVLQEQGVDDNTFVIFSSDNGPENTHPNPGDKFYYSVGDTGGMRGRKRSLLMGGVCVPFIARWPGTIPGGRIDDTTPIAGVDVFPTFLAAAGLPLPKGYQPDGENILPALAGKPWQRSKPMFWFWQGKHTGDDWPAWAVRDGQWGLVMDEDRKRTELHNLLQDRFQKNNLAARNPGRVRTLQAQLDDWIKTLPPLPSSKQVDEYWAKRGRGAPKGKKPAAPKNIDREAAFMKKDLNRDGKLTLEEYLHNFSDPDRVRGRFPGFDKDNDGFLSHDEFVFPNGKPNKSE